MWHSVEMKIYKKRQKSEYCNFFVSCQKCCVVFSRCVSPDLSAVCFTSSHLNLGQTFRDFITSSFLLFFNKKTLLPVCFAPHKHSRASLQRGNLFMYLQQKVKLSVWQYHMFSLSSLLQYFRHISPKCSLTDLVIFWIWSSFVCSQNETDAHWWMYAGERCAFYFINVTTESKKTTEQRNLGSSCHVLMKQT